MILSILFSLALTLDSGQRVVVLLRPEACADGVIANAGIQRDVVARWTEVPGFAAIVDDAALQALQNDPSVASVEPDLPGVMTTTESAVVVGARQAQLLGHTGRGVRVAIVDTGVNSSHADLRDAVVEERCFCRDSRNRGCCPNGQAEQSGKGAARDDLGHGTTVAGIVASRGVVAPLGLAPETEIVAIRVSEADGNVTYTSQVISALDVVLARGDVRVVNMSFAIGDIEPGHCDTQQRALADAIQRVRDRGVVVVAASGNDGSTLGMRAPACIGSVISVGATYDTNLLQSSNAACIGQLALVDRVACFSNADATLDLLAPGDAIFSSSASGGIAAGAGTSFASPHVAAAAALLLAIEPSLTPAQVEELLESTGRPLLDHRTGETFRRLDVFAAVRALRPEPPPSGSKRRAARR